MSGTHAEKPSVLQHHFDNLGQQSDASTFGMWLFLVTEILFFGGLFTAYMIYRLSYPEAFAEASHMLNIQLGGLNTAVLIGSSLTMAMAVYAAQRGDRNRQVIFLILTMVLGIVFLGVKSVEYSHKFQEGLIPGANFRFEGDAIHAQLFFSLYFVMTGLHALHMIIGIGIMAVLTVWAAQGHYTKEYHTPIEASGLYWHFIDIVWIFLFPLLYLIDRHGAAH
jgi:cytochrome c oxidase subunit 3